MRHEASESLSDESHAAETASGVNVGGGSTLAAEGVGEALSESEGERRVCESVNERTASVGRVCSARPRRSSLLTDGSVSRENANVSSAYTSIKRDRLNRLSARRVLLGESENVRTCTSLGAVPPPASERRAFGSPAADYSADAA